MILPRRFFLCYLLAISGIAAGPEVVAANGERPYLEIKLAPPATLSANAMRVARQVWPGPQTEVVPLLLLSLVGYPSFPDFDTREAISVFVFDAQGSDEGEWVGAAKVRAGSATERLLRSHYPGGTKESKGWLWFTPQPSLLRAIADLEERAAVRTDDDISMRIYPQRLKVDDRASAAARMGLGQEGQTLLAEGLQQIESWTSSVRFSRRTLSLTTDIVPLPGSGFAQQLQLELPAAAEASSWLRADRALAYQYRFPASSWQGMWERLRDTLLAKKQAGPAIESAVATLDGVIADLAGTGAAASDWGSKPLQSERALGGKVSYEQLRLVATLGQETVQQWLGQFGNLLGVQEQVLQEGEIDGVRYLKVQRTSIQRYLELDPAQVQEHNLTALLIEYALGQQDESFWPEVMQYGKVVEELSETVHYRAAVDGSVLSTTSLERLEEAIVTARSGDTLADSIAVKLPLERHDALRLQLQLTQMNFAAGESLTQGTRDLIDHFRQLQLEPLAAKLLWRPNHLQGQVTIPVQSFVSYLQLRSAQRASLEASVPSTLTGENIRLPLP